MRSFRRIQLGKMKRFFGGLTLGNEKPKGTPDVWIMYFETNGSGHSGRLDDEFQNELIPDVWMMEFETNWNAGRNFWAKDPWLRLQDEISKFIFRSPSVRKNFEGSRMPFQHFKG
ncbi:hypothetical protein RIR_jg6779.t1 [Rhizophagus irregularis DAOM 181602=DAOM 197198]|nr:hypothetical protein RIR_jg6779.t1 [Rhizophagus irregularis DAOM 181602=DAOM 197198]